MTSVQPRKPQTHLEVAHRPAALRQRRPRRSAIEARGKILDVALQMFADNTYDAVSLRAITIKAKVNIAAPHYYFGSKMKLFVEVFGRCMEPVNRERLRLLDERTAGGRVAGVEEIVRAYVEPYVRLIEGGGTGSTMIRFLSRAMTEQNVAIRDLIMARMDVIWFRFAPALHSALPDVPKATLYWRFFFMMSSTYFLNRGKQWFDSRTEGLCSLSDVDEVIDQLTGFITAGLSAPPRAEEAPGAAAAPIRRREAI